MYAGSMFQGQSFRQRRSASEPSSIGGTAICCRDVDARYEDTLALDNVSLSIEAGTITAVIGPNGSGKSTLFALLSGRMQPTSGTVTISGAVAEVLQATAISSDIPLTVDDVVRIGRYPTMGLLRPMTRTDRDTIDEALERVGLIDLRHRSIMELSGGQRQRALIAQGIAQDASLLVLDEPATGLDLPSQRQIIEIIKNEAATGRTVIFSTHQLSEAAHADTIIALACRCVCCAPTETAIADPAVVELFA